jgi:hypothetical protein
MVKERVAPRITVVAEAVKLEYTDAFDVLLMLPQTTLRMYSNEVVALAAVVVAEQYVTVPPVIDIVMLLLVALAGTAQVAFEVITQVTTAPLVRVVVVYVALLVPTLAPFTFH